MTQSRLTDYLNKPTWLATLFSLLATTWSMTAVGIERRWWATSALSRYSGYGQMRKSYQQVGNGCRWGAPTAFADVAKPQSSIRAEVISLTSKFLVRREFTPESC